MMYRVAPARQFVVQLLTVIAVNVVVFVVVQRFTTLGLDWAVRIGGLVSLAALLGSSVSVRTRELLVTPGVSIVGGRVFMWLAAATILVVAAVVVFFEATTWAVDQVFNIILVLALVAALGIVAQAALRYVWPATAVVTDSEEEAAQLRTPASVQLLTSLSSATIAQLVIGPIIGAFVMITAYVAATSQGWNWSGPIAGLTGIAAAVISGAIGATAFRRAGLMRGYVNPVEFSGLDVRRCRLRVQLSFLNDDRALVAAIAPEDAEFGSVDINEQDVIEAVIARDEARAQLDELDSAIGEAGDAWVNGSAFLIGWRRLHRVEEAFLMFGPAALVVPGALHDERRLLDSQIPSSDRWLSTLRSALTDLSPSGARYLMQAAPTRDRIATTYRPTAGLLQARAALRVIRNAINEYRDNSYQGLVRLRDRLTKTLAICCVAGYLLYALVILQGPPARMVLSAALFFLFGALVGAIYQLSLISKSDSQVEDFGLTTARLLANAVLSGLAAVVGVIIAAFLAVSVAGLTFSPAAGATSHFPAWRDVFDWSRNSSAFVLSALFGLVPGRLLDLLQADAVALKDRIRNSEAAEKSRP